MFSVVLSFVSIFYACLNIVIREWLVLLYAWPCGSRMWLYGQTRGFPRGSPQY